MQRGDPCVHRRLRVAAVSWVGGLRAGVADRVGAKSPLCQANDVCGDRACAPISPSPVLLCWAPPRERCLTGGGENGLESEILPEEKEEEMVKRKNIYFLERFES